MKLQIFFEYLACLFYYSKFVLSNRVEYLIIRITQRKHVVAGRAIDHLCYVNISSSGDDSWIRGKNWALEAGIVLCTPAINKLVHTIVSTLFSVKRMRQFDGQVNDSAIYFRFTHHRVYRRRESETMTVNDDNLMDRWVFQRSIFDSLTTECTGDVNQKQW